MLTACNSLIFQSRPTLALPETVADACSKRQKLRRPKGAEKGCWRWRGSAGLSLYAIADHFSGTFLALAFFGHSIIILWAIGPEYGAAVLKLVSTLGGDRDFDPETIEILVDAFDEAWKAVQASGTLFTSERYVEIARQALAKSIIEDATRGERDQHKLSQSALLKLAQSNLKVRPPPPFQNP